MKVIFFTYAYPPLKAPRSIQISRLVKFSKHKIMVVSCDDPEASKDYTIEVNSSNKPTEHVVIPKKFYRRSDPRRWLSVLSLPDRFLSWALSAADWLLQSEKIAQQDVLVTFGQPMSDHLAGLKIKRALGVKWVAHFSDPWVDNPYRPSFLKPFERKMEREVIEAADRVMFTSRMTADLVMGKYPSSWRVKEIVLPHTYDPERYPQGDVKQSGVMIRYLGNFYPPRSPKNFLRALLKLNSEQPEILTDVRVEITGRIVGNTDFKPICKDLPEGLVKITAPVDYQRSLELMYESDLLLVIDAAFEQSVFLPSKLIDYIGAGRPIFAISPAGESIDIVRRLGGEYVHPNDIDKIAVKLAEQIKVLKEKKPATWGCPNVRDEYDIKHVGAQFDALISKLAEMPQ